MLPVTNATPDIVRQLNLIKMQHNTLFLELKVMHISTECLNGVPRAFDEQLKTTLRNSEEVHQMALKVFSHFQPLLEAVPPLLENFFLFNRVFEEHHSKIERALLELTKILKNTFENPEFIESFREVDQEFKDLKRRFQTGEGVSKEIFDNWGKKSNEFQEKYLFFVKENHLRNLCGETYPTVLRQGEILTLYKCWEAILEQQQKLILEEFPERNSFWAALRVKKLIYSEKNAFFFEFFKQEDYQLTTKKICIIEANKVSTSFDVSALLVQLASEAVRIQLRIQSLENKLIAPIGRVVNCTSGLVRLFFENSYFKIADLLVNSRQQILLTRRFNVIRGITALGLAGIDYTCWKWVGILYNGVRMLCTPFKPTMHQSLRLFRIMRCDEKTAIAAMPIVARLVEFPLLVGTLAYFNRSQTITDTALIFGVALAIGNMTSLAVDKTYQLACQSRRKTDSLYMVIQVIAQFLSIPAAQIYISPWALAYWKYYFTSTNILQDNQLCQSFQAQCQREAFKLLALDVTASRSEIRQAFRKLSAEFHPDKNPAGEEMFQILTKAKDICLETLNIR